MPLPHLEEQREIVRRIEDLFGLADAIERRVTTATARATKIAQAVLAKAFRGDLVPTEAELARQEGREYEPASVLLERARMGRAMVSNDADKATPRRASPAGRKAREAQRHATLGPAARRRRQR